MMLLYYCIVLHCHASSIKSKAVDTSSDVEPGVEFCLCQRDGACAVSRCRPEIHQIGPQGQRMPVARTHRGPGRLTFDAASSSASFRGGEN